VLVAAGPVVVVSAGSVVVLASIAMHGEFLLRLAVALSLI
jgi:hypothetical protein